MADKEIHKPNNSEQIFEAVHPEQVLQQFLETKPYPEDHLYPGDLVPILTDLYSQDNQHATPTYCKTRAGTIATYLSKGLTKQSLVDYKTYPYAYSLNGRKVQTSHIVAITPQGIDTLIASGYRELALQGITHQRLRLIKDAIEIWQTSSSSNHNSDNSTE